MGLRLSLEHEKLGSDFCEHGITQHVTQGAMASQERATVKEEGTENGKNARIEAGKEKNNENFEGEIDKGSNLGIINEAFSMEGPVWTEWIIDYTGSRWFWMPFWSILLKGHEVLRICCKAKCLARRLPFWAVSQILALAKADMRLTPGESISPCNKLTFCWL